MPTQKAIKLLVVILVVSVASTIVWKLLPDRNHIFNGKSESVWINEIRQRSSLSDEEKLAQVEFFRSTGTEGIEALEHALKLGMRGESYRGFHKRLATILPIAILKHIPNPGPIKTGGPPLQALHLVCELKGDGVPLWKTVAELLNHSDQEVRAWAAFYFAREGREDAVLDKLSPSEVNSLLPAFLKNIKEAKHHWTAKYYAIFALRWYEYRKHDIISVLEQSLNDPIHQVRNAAQTVMQNFANPDSKTNISTGLLSEQMPSALSN